MFLVAVFLWFIDFNKKLVSFRVKKFNEAQEKKSKKRSQERNDEERPYVQTTSCPDVELGITAPIIFIVSHDKSADANTSRWFDIENW